MDVSTVVNEQLSPETWAVVSGIASLPLAEDAWLSGEEGTLYFECGGIEPLREAIERFGMVSARRPAIARLLPQRELGWLRVRLLQLLVHAAGAPLGYSGPRLHALYQQHGIPALMVDQVDEILAEALCAVDISQPATDAILTAAKFGREHVHAHRSTNRP